VKRGYLNIIFEESSGKSTPFFPKIPKEKFKRLKCLIGPLKGSIKNRSEPLTIITFL
jgi:hypothetical protein